MADTRKSNPKIDPLVVDGDGLEKLIGASKAQQKIWPLKGGGPPVRRWADGKSARARYIVEEVREWLYTLPVEWPLPDDAPPKPECNGGGRKQ